MENTANSQPFYVAFVVESGVLQDISIHTDEFGAEEALSGLLNCQIEDLQDAIEEYNEGDYHVGVWQIEPAE